jgi:hypothetical protein
LSHHYYLICSMRAMVLTSASPAWFKEQQVKMGSTCFTLIHKYFVWRERMGLVLLAFLGVLVDWAVLDARSALGPVQNILFSILHLETESHLIHHHIHQRAPIFIYYCDIMDSSSYCIYDSFTIVNDYASLTNHAIECLKVFFSSFLSNNDFEKI